MYTDLNTSNQNLLQHAELPEKWPALGDIIMDDENRLWISSIIEDFDVYKWWMLEATGEVITTFKSPRTEPIKAIRNGYMYTLETDEESGL